MATTHTPTTLAADWGSTPKVVRSFLRSPEGLDAKVGKGARWAIDGRQAATLKRRFPKWLAEREAERAARAQARADAAAEAVTEGDEEVTEGED